MGLEMAQADLVESVRDRLAAQGSPLDPAHVAAALRDQGRPVSDVTVLAVHDALCRDAVGAGPLEPLLQIADVTDVVVNGADQIFIDRGLGLEPVAMSLDSEAAVRRLAQRLAASGGRRLDDSTPYVDLRLADGTRFHAVLAPLARPGTTLSLRIPRRRVFTLEEFVASGSMPSALADLLRRLIEQKLAFLISGGTGSGKTTVLNALLSIMAPTERLVIVEDASELRPDHQHVVGLEARPPNIEGAGEVTVRTLVRQALRMRPDRLVVGEVRGHEIADLLAAMNTGHEGGCGTIHANSAADVPSRIEGLALAAGMPLAAVHSQMLSALDVIVHVGRDATGGRGVREIACLVESDGRAVAQSAIEVLGRDLVEGPAADVLARRLRC